MSTFLNPIFIISILIALSVHEWAHGFIAHRLGDPTAADNGRLTLNPLAHLDPLGTILFLTVGFGWGKPVPVNPAYFRNPRRDTALVSIAGPVSNLILAIISFVGLFFLEGRDFFTSSDLLGGAAQGPVALAFLRSLFASSLFLNLALMAFNLLPVAPLDGSKVLSAFIPAQYEDNYEQLMQWGPYILLALLLGERLIGLPLLSGWITWLMDGALSLMLMAVGVPVR